LRKKSIRDEKIATNAHLLQLRPETIHRNYQNLRRFFERDTIATFAPLLGIPPETINSNVQFLNFLGIDPTRYPLACSTSPGAERRKMAWLARALFALGPSNPGRQEALQKVRRLVRENPKILIYSISTLERMQPKLKAKLCKLQSEVAPKARIKIPPLRTQGDRLDSIPQP